jgi:hypothetical protein
MSDRKSIFTKILEAGESYLDSQIYKAKTLAETPKKDKNEDDDFLYGKAVVDEPNYQIASQGYKEKPHRLQDAYLKSMSLKNTVVAAVIQTRQNQVASHASLVKSGHQRGFRIILKDEATELEKIKEELQVEFDKKNKAKKEKKPEEVSANPTNNLLGMFKAEDITEDSNPSNLKDQKMEDKDGNTDDEVEIYNFELDRQAKEKLEEKVKKARKTVEEFITHCGFMHQRPFETKKWNFDAYLRAIVRDSLTYDRICTEIIPDAKNKIHSFMPVDASTIKIATVDLKKYKTFPTATTNLDYAYSEQQLEFLVNEKDVLELDEQKLEAEKYKYVQVVRGKIERAYTEEEMKVGQRNASTDIYNNGYSVAELELLVGLVTSHLNTEYFNIAYFTQGFSSKGILHIQAPINRRKLETIRQQWYHLIKGNRNSFATPIIAGMDKVNWIPLNQNHSEMEFQGWINYLVKMICAIYQIDPAEIGFNSSEMGKSGGGLKGNETDSKISASKDKGLKPLLTFLANYINSHIIEILDPQFILEFTGIDSESEKEALDRQKEEVKFKKTVNEIRAEDNLPPLPGMDDVILDTVYWQWYSMFSEKAIQKAKEMQEQQQQAMMGGMPGGNAFGDEGMDEAFKSLLKDKNPSAETLEKIQKSMKQPLKIEYYKIGS